MKDISNKTVVLLLVATIIISLGGTYISLSVIYQKLNKVAPPAVTGLVLIPNATATLEIQTVASIKFSQASVDFGQGSVDTSGGFTNCSLSTIDEWTNSGCIGFNKVNNSFTIENDGSTNLSVELQSNRTASEFIESNGALYLWNVTLNESSSCRAPDADTEVYPNTSDTCGGTSCGTIFESVLNGSYKTICPRLMYTNSMDELNVEINISIPDDAPTGVKLAGLIVRGTTALS